MTDASANQPLITRWWVRLLILLAGAVGLLVIVTMVRIVETAGRQELHPADAIVVFGAAEYSGHPSPVLPASIMRSIYFILTWLPW
jgi:hypothetical protein